MIKQNDWSFSIPQGIRKRRGSIETAERTESTSIDSSLWGDSSEMLSPVPERSTSNEMECLRLLKAYCKSKNYSFSDTTIHRFASFHDFRVGAAKHALRQNQDNHYLNIGMSQARKKQLQTGFIFPLLNMKLKDQEVGVLYVRPSTYVPLFSGRTDLVESVSFVLNDMSQTKEQCTNGVAAVINMKGFEKDNFDRECWGGLIHMLEGKVVPTRVTLVLFVDAPAWFNAKIWKLTKSMLSDSFSKQVHMIESDRLSEFLMEGFEALLPDEISQGWKSTDEIVEDYIDLKMYQEAHSS
eukprot:scaffold3044_cov103-Cylindrotheca_fusiformis.AAC.4